MEPVLSIKNLRTNFYTDWGVIHAVDGISYDLYPGKTLAVVGESGSGKSVHALSILRLLPQPPAKIASGEILFEGKDLLKLNPEDMRKIRGNRIAMIFQEPMTSLNPVLKVGEQIAEAVMLHQKASREKALAKAADLLKKVGIPHASERINDYPHQFSGGMRQRVMIAIALSCEPKVLIADEPTTALDVTIQAQILELMKDLQREFNMAIVLITHNIGVVAEMADEVAVMYAGRQVEYAKVSDLFREPRHPYTKGLLNSVPLLYSRKERLAAIPGQPPELSEVFKSCPFEPRCAEAMPRCRAEDPPRFAVAGGRMSNCWNEAGGLMSQDLQPLLEVRNIKKHFTVTKGLFGSKTMLKAVDGVSFSVMPQESFAVVGESGCGKTTLSRLLLALERPTAGEVLFAGKNIFSLSGGQMRRLRRDMQVIFQDPFSSLNPRMTVEDILAEPFIIHGICPDRAERQKRIQALMDSCGLSKSKISCHPHEFSGGQRQRIGIARALALNPKLVIADEPVSALDVSIQAQILNLLTDLQKEMKLTYVFISHDFSAVRHLCRRIAVMYLGKVVEIGETDDLLQNPQHPYTEALLSAIPIPDPNVEKKRKRVILTGDVPSPLNPPAGCHFHPRCRYVQASCRVQEPKLIPTKTGSQVACPVMPFAEKSSEAALTIP